MLLLMLNANSINVLLVYSKFEYSCHGYECNLHILRRINIIVTIIVIIVRITESNI